MAEKTEDLIPPEKIDLSHVPEGCGEEVAELNKRMYEVIVARNGKP